MNRGRARFHNRGMLNLLAMDLASEFYQLERKPPVTASLIAANTLIYLRPGALDNVLPTFSEVCLNPSLVIKNRDVKRLFVSAFYHVDESHLVHNMLSLLRKGVQWETMMGSTEFASMVAVLLGMSHGIVVILSKVLATFFNYREPLTSVCPVGFSAVLFALKAVLNSHSLNYSNLYGVLVPARYATWAELLLIQMFVPGVSFLGHLSGIIAGFVYLWLRRRFPRGNAFSRILRKFTWIMGMPLRLIKYYLIPYRRPTFYHATVGRPTLDHVTVGGRQARRLTGGGHRTVVGSRRPRSTGGGRVAMLLGMSHGIVLILAKVLATSFDYREPWTSECAVGFSAVLFALKVVLNSNPRNYTHVFGVLVPDLHAIWAELRLIQMFVPQVSFLGCLSGIIAGFRYLILMFSVQP